MILHHAETWEGCQSMTHGERRSIWAGGYYGAGYHRDDYTDEAKAEMKDKELNNECHR